MKAILGVVGLMLLINGLRWYGSLRGILEDFAMKSYIALGSFCIILLFLI